MTNITKYGQKSLCNVRNGQDKVLYSYDTPVAVLQSGEYFVTSEWHSQTTTKHINFFLRHEKAASSTKIPQLSIQEKARQVLGDSQNQVIDKYLNLTYK